MHKILSVDDEPINQLIVEELFGDKFEVSLASSGEECLQEIDSINPELILLDVSMSGIDGYQTCRELKTQVSTRHIPVFFVSARSTLEDKIKGYEAGGHDYITKPFNHTELHLKIQQAIKATNLSAVDTEEKKIQNHEINPVAMDYCGDANTVIHFLNTSFTCNTLDELAQCLLNTCQQLQLNCTLQFRNDSDKFNYSTNNLILPLELSLLEQTQDKERFFNFNRRMIINSFHISLLIKNMPGDDNNRDEQLKETFDLLISGTESRLEYLLNKKKLSIKYEQIFALIKENITEFDDYSEALREKSISMIEEYTTQINNTVIIPGLNEPRQAELQSITKDFLAKISTTFSSYLPLEEKLSILQNALCKFSNSSEKE